jgi:hypothetical protein
MFKMTLLIVAAAAGTLTATSSFAGGDNDRIQKRDEIWRTESVDSTKYANQVPAGYTSEDTTLPDRQNTHRVMG